MLNLFLDTNILLDCILERQPWEGAAKALIEAGKANRQIQTWVSPLSLKDVYFIVTKAKNEAVARGFVRFVAETCSVASIGASTCALALDGPEPDFEDGLVAAAAQECGADMIVTRDAAAFAALPVPKVDPLVLQAFLLSDPYPAQTAVHLSAVTL